MDILKLMNKDIVIPENVKQTPQLIIFDDTSVFSEEILLRLMLRLENVELPEALVNVGAKHVIAFKNVKKVTKTHHNMGTYLEYPLQYPLLDIFMEKYNEQFTNTKIMDIARDSSVDIHNISLIYIQTNVEFEEFNSESIRNITGKPLKHFNNVLVLQPLLMDRSSVVGLCVLTKHPTSAIPKLCGAQTTAIESATKNAFRKLNHTTSMAVDMIFNIFNMYVTTEMKLPYEYGSFDFKDGSFNKVFFDKTVNHFSEITYSPRNVENEKELSVIFDAMTMVQKDFSDLLLNFEQAMAEKNLLLKAIGKGLPLNSEIITSADIQKLHVAEQMLQQFNQINDKEVYQYTLPLILKSYKYISDTLHLNSNVS